MSFITTIENDIAKYTPTVLAGVLAVENAAKSLAGQTKKAIVVSMVQTAAHAAEAVPNATVAAIAALVDQVVTILNASGLFGHAAQPVTPAK